MKILMLTSPYLHILENTKDYQLYKILYSLFIFLFLTLNFSEFCLSRNNLTSMRRNKLQRNHLKTVV